MDPNTANVWGHDTHQPYARRSISAILGFVIALVTIGAFAGWYFFLPATNEETVSTNHYEANASVQMPGNNYEHGTGRSAVYNFFYKVFGGIESGLEDNPHNLNNVDHLDHFNLDGGKDSAVEAMLQINRYYDRFENIDDGYRYSIYDVVGSDVIGRTGKKAGEVHDVLINKETGEARAVIVDQNADTYYHQDLARLNFKNIYTQQPDGDVRATITENAFEDKKEFVYMNMDERFISLRHLRSGQILDFEGNVAGEVDAIIYRNAEAQRIFFAVKPSLSSTGSSQLFGIPYESANVVENPDGYDIQLTKAQTKSLAESLYGIGK
jgi:sporulation protein YlmC with PRC-barrel domain